MIAWLLTPVLCLAESGPTSDPLSRYLAEVDAELVSELRRPRYRPLRTGTVRPEDRVLLGTEWVRASIAAGTTDWLVMALRDAGAGGWASLLTGPTFRARDAHGKPGVSTSTAMERQGDVASMPEHRGGRHRFVMGSSWKMRDPRADGLPVGAAIWATATIPLLDTVRVRTDVLERRFDATIRRSLWSGGAVFAGTHTQGEQWTPQGVDVGLSTRLPGAGQLRTRYRWGHPPADEGRVGAQTVVLDLVVRPR